MANLSLKLFLPLLSISCLLAVPALSDPTPGNDRSQIEDFYKKSDDAMEKGEMRLAMSFLAPDFVVINEKGKRSTRKELEDRYLKSLKYMHLTKVEDVLDEVKIQDATATIVSSTHSTGTLTGNKPGSLPLDIELRSRDFLVKRDGKWMMKQSRVLESVTKIDGEEISAPDGK